MLMRSGFDEDVVLHQYVGRAQYIFAAVHEIRQMMKASVRATMILGESNIVRLLRGCQPRSHLLLVVEHDLLGHAHAEHVTKEPSTGPDVVRQQINMIEPSRRNALGNILLRLVFEAGTIFD